ncbi:cell division protein [Caballeronia arationis]|uniref:translesion DNA synthesis-associated protein ImuA n=1 Tax=Caballeronia arationis TaxID=1777142 RepID=UPI00074C58C8|nr:translesion DNA synthesis-associated protein ImuA [Caballeronia arationis]SAL05466.1 cell division protein [Caballeronia arationis]
MSALPKDIEDIHPSLWRGNQLARRVGRTVDTGYENLSAQLPGGGWPIGSLVELLVQQPGIGEIRMLQPALKAVAKRPVVLIKPPQVPNAMGLSYVGIPFDKIMMLNPSSTADALWSTEQILKANTCGAVLLWQQHIRADSLRRLLLAAQSSEMLLFVLRPIAAQQDASPAALRLALRPVADGVSVDIIKRKGPVGIEPFAVALKPSPILLSPHGRPSKRSRVEPVVPAWRTELIEQR